VYSIEGDAVEFEGDISLLTTTSGDLDGNGALGLAGEAFLGDRIKFDFIEIYGAGSVSRGTDVPIHPDDHGQLVVGYYIHGRDQAYADSPKFYITRHWKIDDGKLVSVEDY